jgi:hypothetical protein
MLKTIALLFLCSGLALAQEDAAPAAWARTSPLSEARHNACTATLADGQILIAGGSGGSGPLTSVEIYGADGAFTYAASLSLPRSGATCTRLNDGRIVVAGGETVDEANPASTLEVYDPETDTWLFVKGAGVARTDHTATLLPDGRLLLAGGRSGTMLLNTLEIFEPLSNSLNMLPLALSQARARHSAILLGEGRVLLLAGLGTDAPSSSSEIFHSYDATLSPGPDLNSARSGHSATLLDDGRILVAGGFDGSKDLDSAEIYDPVANHFQLLPVKLSAARRQHLALFVPGNGGVLLAGGMAGEVALASTELFDPLEGTFVPLGSLTAARAGMSGAVVSDGILLAAGGINEDGPQSACGLLGLPALRPTQPVFRPSEIAQVSGFGFGASAPLVFSLDVISAAGVSTQSDSRLRTRTLSTTASNTFPATEIFRSNLSDAGIRARLTARATNKGGGSASVLIPIRMAATLALNVPQPTYEGSSAFFQASLSRSSNSQVPMTGRLSLSFSTGTIRDGNSNTIILGETGLPPEAVENVNTPNTFALVRNTVNPLPAGQVNIRAAYSGDAAHDAALVEGPFQPISRATLLAISVSPTNPQVGLPMTITTTVQAQAAQPVRSLSGVVNFFSSGFALGPAQALSVRQGPILATSSRTLTPLTLDALNLTASYTGDLFFSDASMRVPLVVVPRKADTTLTILNPPTSFACGQRLLLNAALNYPPTLGLLGRGLSTVFSQGIINLVAPGSGVLEPDPRSPGRALSTFEVTPSERVTGISLAYSGDAFLASSSSAVAPLNLQPAPVSVRLLPAARGANGSLTLTAAVAASNSACAAVPTGNIEFLDGASLLGVRPLAPMIDSAGFNNAAAASIVLSLPPGTRNFQARYSGDRVFQPGSATPLSVVIQ